MEEIPTYPVLEPVFEIGPPRLPHHIRYLTHYFPGLNNQTILRNLDHMSANTLIGRIIEENDVTLVPSPTSPTLFLVTDPMVIGTSEEAYVKFEEWMMVFLFRFNFYIPTCFGWYHSWGLKLMRRHHFEICDHRSAEEKEDEAETQRIHRAWLEQTHEKETPVREEYVLLVWQAMQDLLRGLIAVGIVEKVDVRIQEDYDGLRKETGVDENLRRMLHPRQWGPLAEKVDMWVTTVDRSFTRRARNVGMEEDG
ncbi:hypothetical protein K490DRAFT_53525 [Saccharata proteae CBS 121410]|uniref:Uncharacterized protein n=1 Tax=Saccharata proteae CBS 121410 TaxID=1314787 RepID=A0A9P4M248_9PEZI|nr:hypothetical protein K490DRAFT_53525 [Saccharata proteae CBS 121410]